MVIFLWCLYLDLCGQKTSRILLHIREQRRRIKPVFKGPPVPTLSFLNANVNSLIVFSSSHKTQEHKPPGPSRTSSMMLWVQRVFTRADVPATQIIPLWVARGQLHVRAVFRSCISLCCSHKPKEEQEQSQAVHSTGVFLLENHSNVSECMGNHGGLLGVRCLLSCFQPLSPL